MINKEYDYIIVGAGLCGLVLAKELSKRNKKILILEKGGFVTNLGTIRCAYNIYDGHTFFSKSIQGYLIYRCFVVGGTSIVSCGNAVEFSAEEYKKLNIDLQKELIEARKESCVRDTGLSIGKASARIMDVANKIGYKMQPMPKFSVTGNCANCGRCLLGCRFEDKWTAVECLKEAKQENIDLITHFSVDKTVVKNGEAKAVEGRRHGFKKEIFYGNKVILSAGGLGTPVILQNSGIPAGNNFFVDFFNMIYGISKDLSQQKELSMSVVCTQFHQSDGFILSPFIDQFLGLIPSTSVRDLPKALKVNRLLGLMNKINDDNIGRVYQNGRIEKAPTTNDLQKLKKGTDIAREILIGCGVKPKDIFVLRPRGAHPGGTAAIGKVVDNNLETKIKNLYVCDASVLPFAPGLPPMLTLIALAKWFGKNIA